MTSHMQHIFLYNSFPSVQNYGVISRFIENVNTFYLTFSPPSLFVLLGLVDSYPDIFEKRCFFSVLEKKICVHR